MAKASSKKPKASEASLLWAKKIAELGQLKIDLTCKTTNAENKAKRLYANSLIHEASHVLTVKGPDADNRRAQVKMLMAEESEGVNLAFNEERKLKAQLYSVMAGFDSLKLLQEMILAGDISYEQAYELLTLPVEEVEEKKQAKAIEEIGKPVRTLKESEKDSGQEWIDSQKKDLKE